MEEKRYDLLIGCARDIIPRVHAFLQKYRPDVKADNSWNMWCAVPVKIGLRFQESKAPLLAISAVQHIHLDSQETDSLKRYMLEAGCSQRDAVLKIVQEVISSHENIQTLKSFNKTKKKMIVEVSLWREIKIIRVTL